MTEKVNGIGNVHCRIGSLESTEVTNQIANGDVFFGNFADLIIALWGGLDITVDPYSSSAKGGVRIVGFQDVDFILRNTASICYGKKSA